MIVCTRKILYRYRRKNVNIPNSACENGQQSPPNLSYQFFKVSKPGSCISGDWLCPFQDTPDQSGSRFSSSSQLVWLEILAENYNKIGQSNKTFCFKKWNPGSLEPWHASWFIRLKRTQKLSITPRNGIFTCWKSSVINSVWLNTLRVFMILTMAASICTKHSTLSQHQRQ